MRDLDDTDREILRLLLADARRSYRDIADRVGLSPPAVSDRVDRLVDLGVIQSFTLDLDRTLLRAGTPVLVKLVVDPAAVATVRSALAESDRIEHVVETADARVYVLATVPDGDVAGLLADHVDLGDVESFEVELVRESDWSPTLEDATLALTCAECGNSVTSEGEAAEIGGEQYHFCCENCLAKFEERFDRLSSGA
jgi:DNA-binding Lrp family transcriptional regulator